MDVQNAHVQKHKPSAATMSHGADARLRMFGQARMLPARGTTVDARTTGTFSSDNGKRVEPISPPTILEASCDNVLTLTAAFWAEVARAAETPEPVHDVILMVPDVEQGAMQMLCDSYASAAAALGDELPDLRAVRVTFEFPPGATRLKMLCDSYASAAAALGDELPDLRAVRATFEFPPAPRASSGGAARLELSGCAERQGFRIRPSGPPAPPVARGNPHARAAVTRLRQWVARVVVGLRVCPFTHSVDAAPRGLEKRGVEEGRVGYELSSATCAAGVLRDFWGHTLGRGVEEGRVGYELSSDTCAAGVLRGFWGHTLGAHGGGETQAAAEVARGAHAATAGAQDDAARLAEGVRAAEAQAQLAVTARKRRSDGGAAANWVEGADTSAMHLKGVRTIVQAIAADDTALSHADGGARGD
ncbi:hypothetical protein JKP88DRAFT_346764 [Tribonema minus]|uniref:Uncharacterized protein n=1 Tax=Tribonema minus TaxID=303371 RepID=A0A836CB00_9STRA|nr:hypothetical protein JKP88DRAFT_346764 [Tribonema minus]